MKKYDVECCCAVRNTKIQKIKYKNRPASPYCVEGGGGELCTNVFE